MARRTSASSHSPQDNTNKRNTNAPCLLLITPKSLTKMDLCNQFKQFGPFKRVSMVKDKVTNTSSGSGYVKLVHVQFSQFSHAVKASEGCDPSYKPKYSGHYAGPSSLEDKQFNTEKLVSKRSEGPPVFIKG